MPVSIGSTKFNDLKGPPPKIQRVATSLFTRPGTGGVGARVLPATGEHFELTLVAIVNDSNRLTTQYGYDSLIGTVQAFSHKGVSWTTAYSTKFFIQAVEIVESRTLARACGIDPDGAAFDYAPAGRIVSRWRVVAVPSS